MRIIQRSAIRTAWMGLAQCKGRSDALPVVVPIHKAYRSQAPDRGRHAPTYAAPPRADDEPRMEKKIAGHRGYESTWRGLRYRSWGQKPGNLINGPPCHVYRGSLKHVGSR